MRNLFDQAAVSVLYRVWLIVGPVSAGIDKIVTDQIKNIIKESTKAMVISFWQNQFRLGYHSNSFFTDLLSNLKMLSILMQKLLQLLLKTIENYLKGQPNI